MARFKYIGSSYNWHFFGFPMQRQVPAEVDEKMAAAMRLDIKKFRLPVVELETEPAPSPPESKPAPKPKAKKAKPKKAKPTPPPEEAAPAPSEEAASSEPAAEEKDKGAEEVPSEV